MNKILYNKLVNCISMSLKQSLNEGFMDGDEDLFNDDNYDLTDYITDYIDLGLPSGTLWCKHNVGAKNETDYGEYYTWGETDKPIKYNEVNNYEFYVRYNDEDGLTELLPGDDIAYQTSNGFYKMPTKEQCDELINNTDNEFVKNFNGSGINGWVFKSKVNNKYIFIPAAGFKSGKLYFKNNQEAGIWSSTLVNNHQYCKKSFNIILDTDGVFSGDTIREGGYSVRGVVNKK